MGILLEAKIKVFQKFKLKTMMENQKGRKVKVLKSDNRGKYISTVFEAYLAGKGIEHQLSIPGRPEQNGVAKRLNRTLTERVTVSSYRLTCQKYFRHRF